MPRVRKSVKARLANLGIYGKPKNGRKAATGKAKAPRGTETVEVGKDGENTEQPAADVKNAESEQVPAEGSASVVAKSPDDSSTIPPSTETAACAGQILPAEAPVPDEVASPAPEAQ